MTPDKILEAAAKTNRQKRLEYGDNYVKMGPVLQALFPKGLKISSARDWNRLHLLIMIAVKLSRYSENWAKGHQDSLRDAAVYTAMLESFDGGEKDADH